VASAERSPRHGKPTRCACFSCVPASTESMVAQSARDVASAGTAREHLQERGRFADVATQPSSLKCVRTVAPSTSLRAMRHNRQHQCSLNTHVREFYGREADSNPERGVKNHIGGFDFLREAPLQICCHTGTLAPTEGSRRQHPGGRTRAPRPAPRWPRRDPSVARMRLTSLQFPACATSGNRPSVI
jgi:hypothetical protein